MTYEELKQETDFRNARGQCGWCINRGYYSSALAWLKEAAEIFTRVTEDVFLVRDAAAHIAHDFLRLGRQDLAKDFVQQMPSFILRDKNEFGSMILKINARHNK